MTVRFPSERIAVYVVPHAEQATPFASVIDRRPVPVIPVQFESDTARAGSGIPRDGTNQLPTDQSVSWKRGLPKSSSNKRRHPWVMAILAGVSVDISTVA
jgi:hypothetical protein